MFFRIHFFGAILWISITKPDPSHRFADWIHQSLEIKPRKLGFKPSNWGPGDWNIWGVTPRNSYIIFGRPCDQAVSRGLVWCCDLALRGSGDEYQHRLRIGADVLRGGTYHDAGLQLDLKKTSSDFLFFPGLATSWFFDESSVSEFPLWRFPKIGVPQIIHFSGIFYYKPSILGKLHSKKPPFKLQAHFEARRWIGVNSPKAWCAP